MCRFLDSVNVWLMIIKTFPVPILIILSLHTMNAFVTKSLILAHMCFRETLFLAKKYLNC